MLINFHFHKFQKMISSTFNVFQCVQVLQNNIWVQWRWTDVWRNHNEKKGVLQLALQLNFWIVEDICNSLYLYIMNVNGQVTWIVKLQLAIYTMQLIATQLQFYQNNMFSITMQFHYNYTHDVMLMSLIVIHLLKYDIWHYEDFWT
jgi:hypothetical protein